MITLFEVSSELTVDLPQAMPPVRPRMFRRVPNMKERIGKRQEISEKVVVNLQT